MRSGLLNAWKSRVHGSPIPKPIAMLQLETQFFSWLLEYKQKGAKITNYSQ
jgi:hypothetical protein